MNYNKQKKLFFFFFEKIKSGLKNGARLTTYKFFFLESYSRQKIVKVTKLSDYTITHSEDIAEKIRGDDFIPHAKLIYFYFQTLRKYFFLIYSGRIDVN